MNYLFLDIEVVPLEISNEDVKTYLMDKKISKEARSLDPNYSKIICASLKLDNDEIKVFYGDNEAEILENAWKIIKENLVKLGLELYVDMNGIIDSNRIIVFKNNKDSTHPGLKHVYLDSDHSKWELVNIGKGQCISFLVN